MIDIDKATPTLLNNHTRCTTGCLMHESPGIATSRRLHRRLDNLNCFESEDRDDGTRKDASD
jgi:hypothetical protein